LTAILAAQVEPFRSWGAHLASFGAQVGSCCAPVAIAVWFGWRHNRLSLFILHLVTATTDSQQLGESSRQATLLSPLFANRAAACRHTWHRACWLLH
jgi:hypothetical protein